MRTQVGIVGAGPAGLVLARLLQLEGIDSVVLERHDRTHVEGRIRAGVLEHVTVDLLVEAGVGERLRREGLVHQGIVLTFAGRRHRIDFGELTGGRSITVYGQHEVVKDLIANRIATGGTIHFEAEADAVEDLETATPRIRYRFDGAPRELRCDFVAGCDGFHGICRAAVPPGVLRPYQRDYPFAWLGILAAAPPASEELMYARHERGFALLSMRTPEISRLYLQCAPDADLADWPDAAVWQELHTRIETGPDLQLVEGPVLQKGITAMRSFVVEPMQHGRLFLAGDAAHIVPPTGAKGMNLAVADVRVLARALAEFYRTGSRDRLDDYSRTCLRRIWRAQRFSWWMTSLLHRFPEDDDFATRIQLAELDDVTSLPAAARALAENYVGLPFE